MATVRQVQMRNYHKQICTTLSIPKSQLEHRGLAGSVSAPNAEGNTEYIGPGPVVSFSGTYQQSWAVWAVYQPFIRGEERGEQTVVGFEEVAYEQAQFPAIDDTGAVLAVQEDDFLITVDGTIYRISNPVISPDQAVWTCMITQQR